MRFVLAMLLFAPVFFSQGCARLPANISQEQSVALQGSWESFGMPNFREALSRHPNKSGVYLLFDGQEAFMARVGLIRAAKSGIDIQYYLFHNDLTGMLLAGELIQAAGRGVRVRLLVDDMGLADRDQEVLRLASHQNVEVRVFNPFSRKMSRIVQYISRFGDVTRRMHNKSLTVDKLMTIVGGRNIGDEYFSANPVVEFGDMDIMAAGKVVAPVADSFDEYWNHPLAYSIKSLVPGEVEVHTLEAVDEKIEKLHNEQKSQRYFASLQSNFLLKKIREAASPLDWVDAVALYDSPDKIIDHGRKDSLEVITSVTKLMESADSEVVLVSPYFVPGKRGVEFLSSLAERGIRVKVITNSYGSNDVAIVHSGYLKYRKDLLRSGVELYEISSFLPEERKKITGGSQASLHAKNFVIDRRIVFVGSLNLDPRSAVENTEIGVVIDSARVGNELAEKLEEELQNVAYKLSLVNWNGRERIQWRVTHGQEAIVLNEEPMTNIFQRFILNLLSSLPIESQL